MFLDFACSEGAPPDEFYGIDILAEMVERASKKGISLMKVVGSRLCSDEGKRPGNRCQEGPHAENVRFSAP